MKVQEQTKLTESLRILILTLTMTTVANIFIKCLYIGKQLYENFPF